MARVLITPHVLSRKLANGDVTFVASDPVNGNSFDNTTQNKTLLVRNDAVGVETIEIPKRFTADSDEFVEDLLSLQPGETYAFDWFENAYYGWDDVDNDLTNENAVIINTSDVGVMLALLPLGSRTTIVA